MRPMKSQSHRRRLLDFVLMLVNEEWLVETYVFESNLQAIETNAQFERIFNWSASKSNVLNLFENVFLFDGE